MVSIIIPCYNDAKYIEQSVQSALNQTYSNKEVILVDDGSNDETKAILKQLEPKITKLITQENLGVSAARNNGIKGANGKYILVLDSDDYFESEFCEKAIKVFESYSDAKVVSCWSKWFTNDKDFQIFKPSGGKINDYLFRNAAIGTSMFKKKDWKSVHAYDESMQGYEDWEFFIRLHQNGGRTYILPEILFHYRKKNNSRNDIANLKKYELWQYIFLKHSELYKENYPSLIRHFIHQLQLEVNTRLKREQSIDYVLGATILKPLRFLKRKVFRN